MTDHLLLVDCSAFAYRAYYSLPAMRRIGDGEPTGAVLGFMSMMWRMLGAAAADQPTHIAAVFDAPGKNFRHTLLPAYKANRDPARSIELAEQLPLMRPVAEVLGMTPVEHPGFEADDVIATLAARAMKAGIRSTIVSSDKDFGQLVVDDWIEIVDPMQRARDPSKSPRRLEADVIAKFGVPPKLVPDLQALAGDTVDNIPGIKGCGPETAARLVRKFGSLKNVLDDVEEIRFPQVRADLKRMMDLRVDSSGKASLVGAARGSKEAQTGADWVRLFLKLTTLRRNVPLKIEFADMVRHEIKRSHLDEIVKALNPAANVQHLFGLDRENERTVERIPNPLEWWREELKRPGQRLPAVPQCGYYRTRLVHRGPWVPARIWREPKLDPVTGADLGQDILRCEVGGRARDPYGSFPGLSLYPIPESEFRFQVADAAHAKAYRPDSPKANPDQPIDILKQPVPHNPQSKRRKKS